MYVKTHSPKMGVRICFSDCRWDEYIISDSEEEGDAEEQFSVAFAAEAVAILAIGCVAGLKGLQKVRKGVRQIGLHIII